MRVVTLVAGLGLVLAGLLAIGYGIQFKEFSVGSTLILSGVIGACTGLLLIGLWTVARELRAVGERIGAGSPLVDDVTRATPAIIPPAAADDGSPFGRAVADGQKVEPSMPSSALQRREELAARDRGRFDPPEPAVVAAPAKRRNLMFSSTARKERERLPGRASEALAPDLLSPDLRPDPRAASFESESIEPPPVDEDVQPKAERPISPEPPRRVERPTSTGVSASLRPPVPREERPPVTVLKSGVVDGMAYTLYSDGSIEAQMPEGMMRFVSIDELRSHLEQRP